MPRNAERSARTGYILLVILNEGKDVEKEQPRKKKETRTELQCIRGKAVCVVCVCVWACTRHSSRTLLSFPALTLGLSDPIACLDGAAAMQGVKLDGGP